MSAHDDEMIRQLSDPPTAIRKCQEVLSSVPEEDSMQGVPRNDELSFLSAGAFYACRVLDGTGGARVVKNSVWTAYVLGLRDAQSVPEALGSIDINTEGI